jgi:hypothetical protein
MSERDCRDRAVTERSSESAEEDAGKKPEGRSQQPTRRASLHSRFWNQAAWRPRDGGRILNPNADNHLVERPTDGDTLVVRGTELQQVVGGVTPRVTPGSTCRANRKGRRKGSCGESYESRWRCSSHGSCRDTPRCSLAGTADESYVATAEGTLHGSLEWTCEETCDGTMPASCGTRPDAPDAGQQCARG